MAARKAELRQKRWAFQQAQQAQALREEQERAQKEWDSLAAGLGPGAPESVSDIPPQAGPLQTRIPTVQAQGHGLTPEEAELWPSLSPETRAAKLEELEDRNQISIVEAEFEALEGRMAMMEGGVGFYEMPPGVEAHPQIAAQLDRARSAIAAARAEIISPEQAYEIVRGVSDFVLDLKFEAQDEIATGQALSAAHQRAAAGVDPILGGSSPELDFTEWVMKAYAGGDISGLLARSMVAAGREGTDALLTYGLTKAPGGGGQGTMPGVQAPPPAGQGAGSLESRHLIDVNRLGGPGDRVVAQSAEMPAPGLSPARTVYEGDPNAIAPYFQNKPVAQGHTNTLLDAVFALRNGEQQRFDKAMRSVAKNSDEMQAFALMAGEVLRHDRADWNKVAKDQIEAVRSRFARQSPELRAASNFTRETRASIREQEELAAERRAFGGKTFAERYPGIHGLVNEGQAKGERGELESSEKKKEKKEKKKKKSRARRRLDLKKKKEEEKKKKK